MIRKTIATSLLFCSFAAPACGQGIKNLIGGAGSSPPPAPPVVVLNPTSLAFGSQTVGSPSAALQVLVSNTGGSTLVISTITIGGTNAADFTNPGTGTCHNGSNVLAGTSCTVKIIFTPSIASTESATLSIADNASGSPHTAPLTGTGVSVPTGTPISACQNLATASTTWYLTAAVSATGTCFSVTADDQTLNLNGFSITYNTANQTAEATGAIVGIACTENDFVHGFLNNATGTFCGSFQNFALLGGGQIIQGGGTTAFNNACAAVPNCTNTVPSHPIRLGGNGSTHSGPSLTNTTITFNCPSCQAFITDYGNSPFVGGAVISGLTIVNQKTGATCAGQSGPLDCQPYRFVLAGGSGLIQNATATTVPAQILNNQVTGGIQGGIMCDAPGCRMENNVSVTPGNPAIEYANNFGIYAWWCGQTVSGNTIGTNPPSTNMDTRGVSIDLTETHGAGCTGSTLVTANTINVLTKNNNTEYGGCADGGAYGIQWDDDAENSAATANTIRAFANQCPSAGLRVSDIGAGNTSSGNTVTAPLETGATLTPTNLNAVTGLSLESGPGAPAFVSVGDSFDGDQSSVNAWEDGCGLFYLFQDSFGDAGHPTGNFAMMSYGNDAGGSVASCLQTYFIDPTFTGAASKTSTDMPISDVNYGLDKYFIAWTYSGTVTGAVSGLPVSGAAITVKASAGGGSATECSTTTNSSGIFSCTFVPGSVTMNALIEFDMSNTTSATKINTSHNPHPVTVTHSGCTTLNFSQPITSTTTGAALVLGGC